MKTDLQNALSQEKYTHSIFTPTHSRLEMDDKNYKIELEKILSKLSTKQEKAKKNVRESKRASNRPLSATTFERLIELAEMLEKKKAEKIGMTLTSIKEHVGNKFKINKNTLPLWLEKRLKFIDGKNNIEDITVEDVKYLWEHHQRLR